MSEATAAMDPAEAANAKQLAAENRARRRAAARLGAAWIMVPLLFEIMCIVGFFTWTYIWDGGSIGQFASEDLTHDAERWAEGMAWGVVAVLGMAILIAWRIGRIAGIHCFHQDGSAYLNGIGYYYLATTIALVLMPPIGIGFSEGLDELGDLFARYLGVGIEIAFYLALFNLIPSAILGVVYGWLIKRSIGKERKSLCELSTPAIPLEVDSN